MNVPIARMYAFLLVLFALLIGFTTNWAVLAADELADRPENRRPLLEAQRIERGEIRSRDGEVIARSRARGEGEQLRFVRRYPLGDLFGHPVGYSFMNVGSSGIERALEDLLVGRENEFVSLVDQLRGRTQAGSDVVTTLDAGGQRRARALLDGRPGSVVAIEPRTGAVRVMVSVPGYDPAEAEERLGELNRAPGSPLLNRATQGGYEPGSTMKVVAAAAAVDAGLLGPDSGLDGSSPRTFSGVPLQNFGGQSFGTVMLTSALTHSVNTAFAEVGELLGGERMVDYMERFGFYQDTLDDYPSDQVLRSGIRSAGELIDAGDGIDVARVAIGQERLQVTPLQMAIVAAGIANQGVLMRPTFVERVLDPDGRVSAELDPDRLGRAVSAEAAADVTAMMARVTQEGTAAGLSVRGAAFAGKTGTAEVGAGDINQPWFIGFAPLEDPEIAVAVTVERVPGGFGGTVAGPIATAVMEEILR